MSPEYLDALFYDWHNQRALVRQNKDILFFEKNLPREGSFLLVFGAGTGRVSTPLANNGRKVLAIDRSYERLLRIAARDRTAYWKCCSDFRELGVSSHFADAVVFPYSTFQLLRTETDRRRALRGAKRSLKTGASLDFHVRCST